MGWRCLVGDRGTDPRDHASWDARQRFAALDGGRLVRGEHALRAAARPGRQLLLRRDFAPDRGGGRDGYGSAGGSPIDYAPLRRVLEERPNTGPARPLRDKGREG